MRTSLKTPRGMAAVPNPGSAFPDGGPHDHARARTALERRRLLGGALRAAAASITGPLLAACGPHPPAPPGAGPLPDQARVLALGDSLTAGRGAPPSQSWPAELARLSGWRVDNAGRNGDTSSGALERLPDLLRGTAYDAIVVAIGGNDMLRSVPRTNTVDNIRQILQIARAHSSHVALVATPRPDLWRASLGHLQDADFYAELARQENILLLAGIYTETLNQPALRADQIHANAQGYALIARRIDEQLTQAGWRR